MEKIEIDLNFNRRDFEEIFFRDRRGSLLFYPDTKSNLHLSSALALFVLINLIYSLITDEYWPLLLFLLIAFIVSAVEFYRRLRPVIVWKKKINEWLDYNRKFTKSKVILSQHVLSLIRDETENIEKWDTISKADIYETHISLEGKTNYLFPKKSMKSEDFNRLKIFISEILKK